MSPPATEARDARDSGETATILRTFNLREHTHLIPYLAGIHGECITIDKMTGTFLSPLDIEQMLKWWKDRIAEANAGTRVIIMLLRGTETTARLEAKHLVGVVMLSMPVIGTGPFRASVESLLVNYKSRRTGAGSTLLLAAEQHARENGKTLLMTEMESGTAAMSLFKKHEYIEAGRVPEYSLRPHNSERREAVFLYKHLVN